MYVPGVEMTSEPLLVRPGCHARLTFSIASPQRAECNIQHLREGELLARECRPVDAGASSLEIKTHPDSSHIICWLQVEGDRIADLRLNVDCGEPIEPISRNFIVIGAMKAGTTALFNLLAQHPAFCRTWAHQPGVSTTKEINYFRHLYQKSDTTLHYDWRFPFEADKHAWTLDVSPSYAKWPASKAVPARIASLGGNVKLAYILRDPVDRIESHLAHRMFHSRKMGMKDHYIRTSLYAMQLDKVVEHIERDNILLLDFEQLRRKPAAVLAQVCDFLDIDPFVPRHEIHNKRGIDFRLNASQRAEFADAVRADVERLITYYHFKPAEKWLRGSSSGWPGLRAYRKIREAVWRRTS